MKRTQTVKVNPVTYKYEKGPIVKHVTQVFLKMLNQRKPGVNEIQIENAISYIMYLRERQIKFGEPRGEHYPLMLADLLIAMQPISAPELILDIQATSEAVPLGDYDDFLLACRSARFDITSDWPPYSKYMSIGLLGLHYREEDDSVYASPAVTLSDDDVKKKMWINYPALSIYGEPVYEVLDSMDLRNEANSLFYKRVAN